MSRLARARDILRTFGAGELGIRILNQVVPPQKITLADLCSRGIHVSESASDCLVAIARAVGGTGPSQEQIDTWRGEWRSLSHVLATPARGQYPVEYDIETETALLLFLLIRWRRPQTVVETGIARGASSFVMLSALQRNGKGSLFSLDIDPGAGELVPGELKNAWRKILINPRKPKSSFADFVSSAPPIDFFFHDSNHRQSWMEYEFRSILPTMTAGGILGSDDVQGNRAFISRVTDPAQRVILLDGRKASGYCVPC